MAEEFDRASGRVRRVPEDDEGTTDENIQEAGQDRQQQQQEDPYADLNLDDVPNFRKFKSTMDQRLAQMQNEAAEERRRREALEQQWTQERMSGMDAGEAAAFRAQLAEQRAQEAERRLQEAEALVYRNQKLAEIASMASKYGYNVPLDVLQDATTPAEAYERAMQYAFEKGQERSMAGRMAEDAQRRANRVDIGGGKPQPVENELQEAYNKAYKNRDQAAMLKAMWEADSQGVTLQTFS